jgi:hypothetical protein
MAISYSHSDIGFLLREENKLQEALEHYRTTVKIREELAAMDPNNARAKLSLVSAYWRTARVSVAADDTHTALDLLANAVKTLAQSKNPRQAAPGVGPNWRTFIKFMERPMPPGVASSRPATGTSDRNKY